MSRRAWVLVIVEDGHSPQQVQGIICDLQEDLPTGTCFARVDIVRDADSVYRIVVPVSAQNSRDLEIAIGMIEEVDGVGGVRPLRVHAHGCHGPNPDPGDPCGPEEPENAWG